MKQEFSVAWKASTQPRKQRKYRFQAPLHIKVKFLHANLSKDLRKEYGIRSFRVRKGDTVRVMRGSFAKLTGKVEQVNVKKSKIFVEKAEHIKKEGTKVFYPLDASNVQIISLQLDDKQRVEQLKSFKEKKKNVQKNEKPVKKQSEKK